MILRSELRHAFELAIERAAFYEGATSPNPPVGAAAIDANGRVISVQAHEMAGTAHAEANVIADLATRSLLREAQALVVTLEPCNHQGRTPPCTQAIIESGIREVWFGAHDPNPRVKGAGAEALRQAGVQVFLCPDSEISKKCASLIRAFSHWARTGVPWVTLKTAHLGSYSENLQSMIPPPDSKTFTSAQSLRLAHELRRRSPAILTGSGTITADSPEFTVRYVKDHDLYLKHVKKRRLVVMDRSSKTPATWIHEANARGFEVWVKKDLRAALLELGKEGITECLIEAGPRLTSAVLSQGLWNEHVIIIRPNENLRSGSTQDTVRIEQNVHWNY